MTAEVWAADFLSKWIAKGGHISPRRMRMVWEFRWQEFLAPAYNLHESWCCSPVLVWALTRFGPLSALEEWAKSIARTMASWAAM